MGKKQRFDIHQHITDQIVAAIERGAGEFRLPWHRSAGNIMRPINVASKIRAPSSRRSSRELVRSTSWSTTQGSSNSRCSARLTRLRSRGSSWSMR